MVELAAPAARRPVAPAGAPPREQRTLRAVDEHPVVAGVGDIGVAGACVHRDRGCAAELRTADVRRATELREVGRVAPEVDEPFVAHVGDVHRPARVDADPGRGVEAWPGSLPRASSGRCSRPRRRRTSRCGCRPCRRSAAVRRDRRRGRADRSAELGLARICRTSAAGCPAGSKTSIRSLAVSATNVSPGGVARERPRKAELARFRAESAPGAGEGQVRIELHDAVVDVVGDIGVARSRRA